METFKDFYDIESPRSSEIKMETIENSIHHSLLYNNETPKTYNLYKFLWKLMLTIVIIVFIIIVIIIVLFVIKQS